MKKIISCCLFVSFSLAALAQNDHPKNAGVANKSPIESVYVGFSIPASDDVELLPEFTHIISKNESENKEALEMMKKAKLKQKLDFLQHDDSEGTGSAEKTRATIDPIVSVGYNALSSSGTPSDNSIAVNKTGQLVAVVNSSLRIYNATTGAGINGTVNLDNFFTTLGTNLNTCDPKVIFDQQSDRFIVFAQNCDGNSASSKLFVAFSKTADPTAGWYFYKFSGNIGSIIGVPTWFDYPKIAVSTNELYITGNSFSNSSIFQESLLYQIEKNSGYSGGILNWQYWNNISSNPFTLLPVSSGQQGNYGPGCFLVSTQGAGSSTINLYDLTDDMSATNETLVHYSIPTTTYSPAADGDQLGTLTKLDNGDCRALSGFYQNGIIHFVFHSDYSNGYNGINYNRLNVTAQTNISSTFGLIGYEYSYPSVASFASTPTDKSVMIGFGRTGENIYPEIRVVNCDDNMTWGSSTLVKAGSGYAEYTASGGSAERWGDYTGMCRKHNNSAPTVWMNGMFGTTSNDWETWVAEITGTGGTTGITNDTQSDNFKLYPNPIYQEFKTEFELSTNSKISIDIFDIQGKLVRTLFNGNAISGKNIFTFNKSNLEIGTYFINISSNNQTLKNEKIIIAN